MKKTETIQIQGMSCGHCVMAVRDALQELEGVEVETVEIGSARVSFDEAQADRKQVEEAIEEAGYRVA